MFNFSLDISKIFKFFSENSINLVPIKVLHKKLLQNVEFWQPASCSNRKFNLKILKYFPPFSEQNLNTFLNKIVMNERVWFRFSNIGDNFSIFLILHDFDILQKRNKYLSEVNDFFFIKESK